MWYNVGIANKQRAFIHCHNVRTYINFASFDCPPANTKFARFAGAIRLIRKTFP